MATIAVLLAVGPAGAFRFIAGDIVITGNGGFYPRALPQGHDAPILLRGHARISTLSGDYPPIIQTIKVDWDRHGSVQTEGLPVCTKGKLSNTTVAQARHACPGAIVGEGFARGVVVFPDSKPIPVSSPITVFNGPEVHGQDTIIGHGYTTVPVPTTYIVPVVIQRIHEGRYGYRTIIRIPPIAGGYGIPLAGQGKIDRKWTYRGVRHSFINARCADGHLQVRGSASFSDGTVLKGSLAKPCQILERRGR